MTPPQTTEYLNNRPNFATLKTEYEWYVHLFGVDMRMVADHKTLMRREEFKGVDPKTLKLVIEK